MPWSLTNVSTFTSLKRREWLVLWSAGHFWHLAFWMDLIVLSWVVLDMTDSPLLVALVGTCRFLPLGIIGIFAGSLGDRMSKRKLLIIAQTLNIVVTLIFLVVVSLDLVRLWHVYVVAILVGSSWAVDYPVRRALIRDLLPESDMINAMAIDAASLTGMAMAGRWIGGSLLAGAGVQGAYIFLAICYLCGLTLLLRIDGRVKLPIAKDAAQGILRDVLAGLAFMWSNKVLRGVLLATLISNIFFFPYFQLTPVFARDVFEVGPILFGIMSGMDGLGSLVGTVVLASIPIYKLGGQGKVFVAGGLLLGLGAFVFSQMPSIELAMLILVVIGLGTAAYATMQVTMTLSEADVQMRGRAMGAISLAIGTLPAGMAIVGLLAGWLGAPMGLGLFSMIGGILMIGLIILRPELRRYASASS